MSFRILLVDPDSLAAAASQQALVETGYRVMPVSTFQEATRQMSLDHPDLLVTKVRLGSFNGLHLLLRCRAEHPDVPVIIVGTSADRTADVTRFGAEFVTSPIEHASFLELVATLLSGRTPSGPTNAQRGPRNRPLLPATASDRSARAVESRYREVPPEGARAQDAARLPVEISLPTLESSVTDISDARCWQTPVNPVGGAQMALPDLDLIRRWRWTTRRWRGTIDSLN
jgi:DNA-binding response OmpR family regulator